MYASALNFLCGFTEPGLHRTCPRSTASLSIPRSRQPTLSPATPSSNSLRNISTPVTTDFCVSRSPTISTSSPTLILPRSMRPVTTVPRPEIENTSSIGIKNGWSIGRSGSGTNASSASKSFSTASSASSPFSPLSALIAAPRITGTLSPGNWYLVKSSRTSSSTRSRSSGSSTTSTLLRNTDVGDANLAREQNVLARLRHGAVRRRHHQDRPVHLRRPRDHVLDVVGMPRAIHMRVVALLRAVFHVARRNGQNLARVAPPLALRRLRHLVIRHERRRPALLRRHLRHRSRQRRLAVVHVTNRSNIAMRLRPFEFLLGHGLLAVASRCSGGGRRPPISAGARS